jgi:3-methyladenine DNA glycosylase/8-oxoguanine DNA glycosylase
VSLVCELPLRGAGGEPVSFARTVRSHGCARLPPAELHVEPLVYRRPFRVGGRVVDVAMHERAGRLVVQASRKLRVRDSEAITKTIARMFRLEDDLSPFYARIADGDPLAWAARGAGRMLASPTVFEDVIKTICTTNCAWSATVRMARALSDLGGGAFPESEALARAPDAWYRDTARMGYRGSYVKAIARDVAGRTLDLEALRNKQILDAEVEGRLLDLPGIGPYGAASCSCSGGTVGSSWTLGRARNTRGSRGRSEQRIRRFVAPLRVTESTPAWRSGST